LFSEVFRGRERKEEWRGAGFSVGDRRKRKKRGKESYEPDRWEYGEPLAQKKRKEKKEPRGVRLACGRAKEKKGKRRLFFPCFEA